MQASVGLVETPVPFAFAFDAKPNYLVAMISTLLTVALAASPAPAMAQPALEQGFSGALRGCEEWVLNPASWAGGTAPFIRAVGLGETMGEVSTIPDVAQPPATMRRNNHYWRINSTVGAGFFLVVSDTLPMCHITGGGQDDFQPVIEGVLASPEFTSRWEKVEERSQGELVSTRYRSREDPKFGIVISRANKPGQRTDRVQILATASFDLGK